MTVIPFISSGPARSTHLFVFADFQIEYIASGRAYAVEGAGTCIENSKRLLDHARRSRLPIVHFRQMRSGAYFNRSSPFSRWIDAFQPRTNEMLFERARPSCYANRDFCAYLEDLANPSIVLVGLGGDQACLATSVEAYHRDHRVFFLRDCSATAGFGDLTAAQSHEALCHVIASYAEVLTHDQMMIQMVGARARGPVAV